jgi:thioredoxin 1
MKTIDEKEFNDLISNGTTVVQFSASWCGPCKTLTKTIENNKDSFNNPIYKIDIDDNSQLATALGIKSVPTIIRFENKEEKTRLVGAQGVEKLAELTI